MVVEQIAIDVENRNQPHWAAALGATNGLLDRRFGNGFLCQQITPTTFIKYPALAVGDCHQPHSTTALVSV